MAEAQDIHNVNILDTLPETNIAGWKIQHFDGYLPGNMGIFQPAMLVCRRITIHFGVFSQFDDFSSQASTNLTIGPFGFGDFFFGGGWIFWTDWTPYLEVQDTVGNWLYVGL